MPGRGRAALAAGVLVLALSGCAEKVAVYGEDTLQGGAGAAGRAPSGTYLSTEVTEGGQPRELVSGTRIGLTIEDGSLRSSAGCNTMSGSVRFDDGRMLVEELAITEVGCPGDGRHEQDEFLAEFLTDDPAYTSDGTDLTLTRAADQTVIELTSREVLEPDLPLEGTRWEVTSVTVAPPSDGEAGPDTPVASGPVPEEAYLKFHNGKVHGGDGCNSLSGPAAVAADTITFGPITSTKVGCPHTEEAAQAMRAVLAGEVQWRIDADSLHLQHPSGDALILRGTAEHGDSAAAASQGAIATAECSGKKCYEFDLGARECLRNGRVATIPDGAFALDIDEIRDYDTEARGAPTPEAALRGDRFFPERPRSAFRYDIVRAGQDNAVARRLLVDGRVVATLSMERREPGGGWLVTGMHARSCSVAHVPTPAGDD